MEIRITNYIDISGQDIPMDTLPKEKMKEIAELLQVRMMSVAGFRRVDAEETKAKTA